MKHNDIIKSAQERFEKFKKLLRGNPYQKRGIFNSELLLICSVIEELGVKNIIESGRARGHSTQVLCDCFGDGYVIHSIDFDKDSKDAKYAERNLNKYKNLELLYGDSNLLLPSLISEDSAVIIDGPKGEDALILAINLLKNKQVKAIFIHDLYKSSFERNIFDILFTETFCSDDLEYVELSKVLDEECWKVLKESGYAPYLRNNRPIRSYASTIAIAFNGENSLNLDIVQNYLEYYNKRKHITLSAFLSSYLGTNSWFIAFLRKLRHKFLLKF